MPRPVVPSHVNSASRVMLLAAAIRPLIVMALRLRNSIASLDDMAVAAWTDMTGRVLGLAAHRADGAARLHEGAHALDERGGLGARDVKARDGGLLLCLLLQKLGRLQPDPLAVLIVAQAEGGDCPCRVQGLQQRDIWSRIPGAARKLGQESPQVLGERADLFLLALQREEASGLSALEVEHALSRRPDRAGREVIGRIELERVAHRMCIPLGNVWCRAVNVWRLVLISEPARRGRGPWN